MCERSERQEREKSKSRGVYEAEADPTLDRMILFKFPTSHFPTCPGTDRTPPKARGLYRILARALSSAHGW